MQTNASPKQPLGPFEADVLLAYGRSIRVSGLLAVQYSTDPEGTRQFVTSELAKRVEANNIGLPSNLILIGRQAA